MKNIIEAIAAEIEGNAYTAVKATMPDAPDEMVDTLADAVQEVMATYEFESMLEDALTQALETMQPAGTTYGPNPAEAAKEPQCDACPNRGTLNTFVVKCPCCKEEQYLEVCETCAGNRLRITCQCRHKFLAE